MDLSDYLPMFLAEGREHLQNLNLAIVRVEQDPSDGETINEIFRIAHSLKGMSATMGFARMAALTHEMESVMEGLRSRADALDTSAVNALFACLDMLERMTDEIEASGTETTDPTPLVSTLQQLGNLGVTAQAAPATPDGVSDDVIRACEDSGLSVVRVGIVLADDVDMPGVRAYVAVRGLENHGQILHAVPTVDEIEAGELAEGRVTVWIATGEESGAVAAAVAGGEGIGSCTADPVPAGTSGGGEPSLARRALDAVVGTVTDLVGVVTGSDATEDSPPPEATPSLAAPAGPAAAEDRRGGVEDRRGTAADAPGKGKPRVQTVRVEADRLDSLMHLMGEMVVQRTRLESIATRSGVPELQSAVGDLSRVAQSLQAMVMQVRMVPVESVFMRFPRMVRDLSSKLGKTVDLQLLGEDTELDRTVVEALGDPLVHLVRNALDHGLESPEERQAAGKPAVGSLVISAEHAGGEVLIRVKEDGRGVDPRKVGAIAASRGLIAAEAADTLSVEEAVELLFAPGFSTAAVMSDVSGRGVGMDAVRTMVRALGGDCSVASELGHGSCATIRLPLSLAILPALLVECDGEPYALPLDRVEQTIRVSDYALRSVGGEHAIVLRDNILPLHDLSTMLAGAGVEVQSSAAVVVRAGTERVGLVVERLVGQQELVTRPLPALTDAQRACVSGGAVLGDGQIALIVDIDTLVSQAKAA